MNISSTTNATSSIFASQAAQSTSPSDDTGDDSSQPVQASAGHRGHGHVMKAVLEALHSLGLSPASSGDATSDSSGTTGSQVDATGATGASTDTVRQDMHQFMHALFEALKGEGPASGSASSSSSSSPGDGSSSPQTRLSSDLSSLISDVGNGHAPSDLQDAFSKLASDLQSGGGASTSTSSGSGSEATLQAFLTALQQDLGYGSAAPSTSAGSLVTTQA